MLKKAKLWGQQKGQGLPGVSGEGGMKRPGTEDLKGSTATLRDAVTVGPCHHALVNTHRLYRTKREPAHKLQTLGDGMSMRARQL